MNEITCIRPVSIKSHANKKCLPYIATLSKLRLYLNLNVNRNRFITYENMDLGALLDESLHQAYYTKY